MKITYTANPLDTKIELDEHEVQLFRKQLQIEELQDMLFSAHFDLTRHDWLQGIEHQKVSCIEERVSRVVDDIDPDYFLDKNEDGKTKLDLRVDTLLEHYLEELASSHRGDCTCAPASCSKCHAESLLGINTLEPYPGKHVLSKINSGFQRYKEQPPEVAIDEVINDLRSYDPVPTGEWLKHLEMFKQHLPKWKEDTDKAATWLQGYRDKHFKKETSQ